MPTETPKQPDSRDQITVRSNDPEAYPIAWLASHGYVAYTTTAIGPGGRIVAVLVYRRGGSDDEWAKASIGDTLSVTPMGVQAR